MRSLLLTFLIAATVFSAQAQKLEISGSRKAVRLSGDITAALLPASCLVATLMYKDYTGIKQGLLAGATTVGLSYGLKLLIKKERPDRSNYHSFPSLHTSTAFVSAAFLQKRYGWKWGAPAYFVAAYTGWSRIYAKKHDTWDVLAGAAIGAGCAYLFTRSFIPNDQLSILPMMNEQCVGLHASFVF